MLTSRRESSVSLGYRLWRLTTCMDIASRKVWDTYSGQCLHTFPHNHIVRATAIDAPGERIITGGHEKKLRLFDLSKPDADPQEFLTSSAGGAHEGNIKSVVWGRGPHSNTIISAGEDKTLR